MKQPFRSFGFIHDHGYGLALVDQNIIRNSDFKEHPIATGPAIHFEKFWWWLISRTPNSVAWPTEKIWRWLISRTSNSGPHYRPTIYQQCARLHQIEIRLFLLVDQVRPPHHSDQMSQGVTSPWRPTPPTNPSTMCKTRQDKDLRPTQQIVDDHPATTSSSFNLNSITERSGLRCCTISR